MVQPQSIFFCENGRWRFQGQTFNDTHEYDWLPVHRILRYSSNIGAGKIGLKLGAKDYYGSLHTLGMGQPTGVPLPAESKGLLRPPGAWNQVDLVAASFGQGLSVTGLQMAQAYLTLCTQGKLRPLRLVRSPQQKKPAEKRVFSSKTASRVLGMLHDVVQEDGTGTKARIPGLRVGGKTGTAQKASALGGYGQEYVASFIGIFPALKPRYLVLCIVDEPQGNHYGGVVAAPVVREVGTELLAWSDMHRIESGLKMVTGTSPDQSQRHRVSLWHRGQAGGVPDLRGLSLRRALEILIEHGVMPRIRGQGPVVDKQSPQPGSGSAGNSPEQWTLWLSKAD